MDDSTLYILIRRSLAICLVFVLVAWLIKQLNHNWGQHVSNQKKESLDAVQDSLVFLKNELVNKKPDPIQELVDERTRYMRSYKADSILFEKLRGLHYQHP